MTDSKTIAREGDRKYAEFVRKTVSPRVGSTIVFDAAGQMVSLEAGDDFVDSGFPGCDFRLAGSGAAVNVRVTGRTLRRWRGFVAVRCEIEIVGDGEPSEFVGGWILPAD